MSVCLCECRSLSVCVSVRLSVCLSVCVQLSEIGVELGFILDELLSSDLNKLIQQAGDNQMDAVRHRATVSIYYNTTLLYHHISIPTHLRLIFHFHPTFT